jgi:hypothetical protein
MMKLDNIPLQDAAVEALFEAQRAIKSGSAIYAVISKRKSDDEIHLCCFANEEIAAPMLTVRKDRAKKWFAETVQRHHDSDVNILLVKYTNCELVTD